MPYRRLASRTCEGCDETYKPSKRDQKYCSPQCARMAINARLIKKAIERKRIKHASGCWLLRLPDGTRVFEHRYVYEQSRGVALQTWHYLKWINGDKLDNRPENLAIANRAVEAYVQRTGRLPAEMGRSLCPCGGRRQFFRWPNGQARWTCTQCREKTRRSA